MPASKKIVLHIDDSPDDLFLFQKACDQAAASFQLQRVNSGAEALNYLGGAGPYLNRSKFPQPDLILLDLKMPVADGFSVLHWLRDQPKLRQITVCIFTSSFQYEDIEKAYAQGATYFLTKPAAFEKLVTIAAAIDQFLTSSELEAIKKLPEFRQ